MKKELKTLYDIAFWENDLEPEVNITDPNVRDKLKELVKDVHKCNLKAWYENDTVNKGLLSPETIRKESKKIKVYFMDYKKYIKHKP